MWVSDKLCYGKCKLGSIYHYERTLINYTWLVVLDNHAASCSRRGQVIASTTQRLDARVSIRVSHVGTRDILLGQHGRHLPRG